jgi:hypothetical protein
MIHSKEIRGGFAISIAIIIIFSSVLIYPAAAQGIVLNLPPPSTLINMEVSSETTTSYRNMTLTNVPEGYDVTNASYDGWCVDRTGNATSHQVYLYSSLDPPGTMANERWDMVNYILNHKPNSNDISLRLQVQDAIWYFISMDNSTFTPPDNQTLAWGMIDDALANGTGFSPTYGQTVAVICDPSVFPPETGAIQVTIFELTIPAIPEYTTAMIPLLLLASLSFMIISRKKSAHPQRSNEAIILA